jgi:hypothetical protein
VRRVELLRSLCFRDIDRSVRRDDSCLPRFVLLHNGRSIETKRSSRWPGTHLSEPGMDCKACIISRSITYAASQMETRVECVYVYGPESASVSCCNASQRKAAQTLLVSLSASNESSQHGTLRPRTARRCSIQVSSLGSPHWPYRGWNKSHHTSCKLQAALRGARRPSVLA